MADTSVVINLNATGNARAIIEALPFRIVTVDVVARELSDGIKKGRNDAAKLSELVAANLVSVVTMGDLGLQHFENLVVGPATETLDDGEAATIAYCIEMDATALLDERKAARLCARRFPALSRKCTVDLLVHEAVQQVLGPVTLSDSVYRALTEARMQVPEHHLGWVLDVIGQQRAAACLSLPASARKVVEAR